MSVKYKNYKIEFNKITYKMQNYNLYIDHLNQVMVQPTHYRYTLLIAWFVLKIKIHIIRYNK